MIVVSERDYQQRVIHSTLESDAYDLEASDLEAYRETLDAAHLVTNGHDPLAFVIRPLKPSEYDRVQLDPLRGESVEADSGYAMRLFLEAVRWGCVKISNLRIRNEAGEILQREVAGRSDLAAQLPMQVRAEIGSVIVRLTTGWGAGESLVGK